MKKLGDRFAPLDLEGEVWFAGANTEAGFSGSYREILDEASLLRLIIIKGGPGCGKSTLMQAAAKEAEKNGHRVVRYLCGSDANSLDAVVIDGKIALADGTAPHPLEMRFPGAASSLLNLSAFWDTGMLEARREEIRYHSMEKGAAYGETYRLLGAAGKLLSEIRSISAACFEAGKADGAIRRLTARLKKEGKLGGEAGCAIRRYSHGITMRGLWRVKTAEEGVSYRFAVEDEMGCAALFLSMLAEHLSELGCRPSVGMMPLLREAAVIRAGDCSFRIGGAEEGDIPIRMSRFSHACTKRGNSSLRGRLRLTEKIFDSCLSGAADCLSCAAEHHFALEAIYGEAMDFARLSEIRAKQVAEILERLE